ncbi:MAG TPA: DUF6159 family protein [Anaerolineales bacterium]|nr:DUF6159 family protein [Anaerolineales bacterium]
MFDSLSRGWGFFKQAVDMAMKDRDLIKPSIYSFFANAVVGFVFAIPIVIAVFIFGGEDNFVGRGVIGILGAILLFAQYTVTYVFSGMTVYLIYGYLSEGDGQMDKAWAVIKRDFLDIMSLAAASALVKVVENTLRGRGKRRNVIGGLVANILDTVWTTATYFVLPAMVIEDLNLWNALKRATNMIKNNLLLVGVGYVGVSVINGVIGGSVIFVAILIAVGIAFALGSLGSAALIVGIVVGVVLVVLVSGIVQVFTSYIGTAYHTCLFIWARDAEKAQQAGQSVQAVRAPAPLAAVLGR